MSEAPRRIIFVNRVYWPSGEATAQLLTDLAEGLAARGWPVHVIAAGEASTLRKGVTIHRTGAGDRHGGLISRWLNFRRFQRAARQRLATLARPGDVVVAMTDPPLLGAHLAALAAKRGARLVCWVQDIYPEIAAVHFGRAAGFVLSRLRHRRDAAWQGASACVTLGDDMRRVLLRQGVPPGRATVIPNWAPRELHQPAAPADIAARRRAWGAEGRFVVAYSGNLGRVHEFATVLATAARLRDRPEIVFVFIGRGPRFAELARVVRERNLANVRLLPPEPRERLAAALAAADAHLVTLQPDYAAFVYPSKLAGVLAAARPVLFVGPTGGDIARMLTACGCGAAFAPGDAGGLAGAIARWRDDPASLRVMGEAARTAYERELTCDAALTRWDQLLRRAGAPA
ncbi:MAG: glycosyltransferase family 4 protein [Verrucomicrobiota bacterium]